MYEYELEALSELEGEFESEFEAESELEGELEAEGEEEAEAFFGTLARLARRALSSPALRRVAQTAAQSALNGAGPQAEYAYEYEEEAEWESEAEAEAILNPIRRVYPDALMEHFGHAAAEAESEEEAEAFAGALIPLARSVATRVLPRIARSAARTVAARPVAALARVPPTRARGAAPTRTVRPGVVRVRADQTLRRATPQLVRGVRRMTRTLRSRPATRPLIRVMPTVVQRTVNTLGQRAAAGAVVTPNQAVRTLAQQAARVLGNPQQAVRAYQRSVAQDRRFHAAGPGPNLCPSCQQRICSLCRRSY
jgi:hypothetical protein